MRLSNAASFSVLGNGGSASLEVGRSAGATGLLAVQSGAQLLVEGESGGSSRLNIGQREGSDGTLTVTGSGPVVSIHSPGNGIQVGKSENGRARGREKGGRDG